MSNTDVSSLPLTSAEASQGASPGVPTGDLVRHKFPRTPERDADGTAVLYPGTPIYEGVGAVWHTRHGEVVIMAPNIEALEDQIALCGCFNGILNRGSCRIVKLERLPNVRNLPTAQTQ